jgi:nicotinate-nucleotide adenylyltransferase
MNVALLFGSFNPVHNGHLAMAHAALQSNTCDEVWFVVSPHNPLKDFITLAPANDRANMVSLALMDEECMKLCTIELDMPKPSYTIHTIQKLKEEYPSFNFHILCGTDVVNQLSAWYKYEELIQSVTFLVCSRETDQEISSNEWIKKFPEQFEFIPFEAIDVSSTMIRKSIANSGKSDDLSESVNQFIIDKKLYHDTDRVE